MVTKGQGGDGPGSERSTVLFWWVREARAWLTIHAPLRCHSIVGSVLQRRPQGASRSSAAWALCLERGMRTGTTTESPQRLRRLCFRRPNDLQFSYGRMLCYAARTCRANASCAALFVAIASRDSTRFGDCERSDVSLKDPPLFSPSYKLHRDVMRGSDKGHRYIAT